MKKLALVATLLAATLAGCGTTGLPTARALQAKPAQTATKSLTTKTPTTAALTLTKATFLVIEPAPLPGHNDNVRQRFDFAGELDGKPFSLRLLSINPNGNFFVAFVDKVVLNGADVSDKAELVALGKRLRTATNASGGPIGFTHEAASILLHGTVTNPSPL